MSLPDIRALQAIAALLPSIQAIEARMGIAATSGRFATYFLDDGPLRRELYPKQVAFFKAGAEYYERLFMKANRVGGTSAGAFELTCHLTGLYPAWWEGRRFKGPTDWWIVGKDSKTTRDILQHELLGPFGTSSQGMIPGHLVIGEPSRSHGIPNAYESFMVRHVPTGGVSRAQLKSSEQGRQSFEGTSKHGVWIDEEPERDAQGIYAECLTRTMIVEDAGERTSGIIFVTFTPLKGLTSFIQEYMTKAVLAESDGSKVRAESVWEQTGNAA